MAEKKQPPKPLSPELAARLNAKWPSLRLGLLKLALKACRHEELAEDIVGDAHLAILEGSREWDGVEDLEALAGSVVNSMASHHYTSAQNRRERLSRGDDDEVEDAAPSSRNPQRLTIAKEEEVLGKKVLGGLDTHFEPADKVQEYLAAIQRGITSNADLAETLGLTIRQVKYLKKRVMEMLDELGKENQ